MARHNSMMSIAAATPVTKPPMSIHTSLTLLDLLPEKSCIVSSASAALMPANSTQPQLIFIMPFMIPVSTMPRSVNSVMCASLRMTAFLGTCIQSTPCSFTARKFLKPMLTLYDCEPGSMEFPHMKHIIRTAAMSRITPPALNLLLFIYLPALPADCDSAARFCSQRHESRHISSIPFSAFQPRTLSAFETSA